MSRGTAAPDAITLEVISNRLAEIVASMERSLFHSGYSTILRESFDGSAVITNASGDVVAGSGHPIHIGPFSYTVRAVLRQYGVEAMRSGDSYVATDPYVAGNLHVPDLVIVTPVIVEDELLGFCASLAHKTDLGGIQPGSVGFAAREILHEGLLLPCVKYWTGDGVVDDIDRILRANSRTPELVSGDTRAQVGCTKIGTQKLHELCEEYGRDTIAHAFERLQDLSEHSVRQALLAWPDGESEAEAWLDTDGVSVNQRVRVHVRLTKRRDTIEFDFSGMAGQVAGPINIRPQVTESISLLALLSALDPTIAINGGATRPVEFVNPEGRLTNPARPAPVNSHFWATVLIYNVAVLALAKYNPARAVGSAGAAHSASVFRYRAVPDGKHAVQFEPLMSSLGATAANDGVPYAMVVSHHTPNTAVEILETEYPVRVLKFEPIIDSGGPGQYRGGHGYRKEYQVLSDAEFNIRMAAYEAPAWGVFGGQSGSEHSIILNPGEDGGEPLTPIGTREVRAGDVIQVNLPGGGGYGNPERREPSRVLEDVRNGYVSSDAARDHYAVVVDASSGELDGPATAELRAHAKESTAVSGSR